MCSTFEEAMAFDAWLIHSVVFCLPVSYFLKKAVRIKWTIFFEIYSS